ncbi:cellulase family glycosylhydrolase [Streptomyces sp. NPDC048664]|uniref:glycoside hydrolase family 5 protein n=1 Tax=Streptomyces sp. NPDC048664 TaxID=3154505 RepID=UPI003431F8A5
MCGTAVRAMPEVAVHRLLAAAVCSLLLAAGMPAAASGAPAMAAGAPVAPAPPGVPRLTDDHGRVLTLHGWNIEDKSHRGDQALSAITERHLRDMRAQGFDFARLLVFWDDLEPRRGHYSEAYLRRIERILDWAEACGIKVVIDAHQDVFGPAFGHRGIPGWATRTDGLSFTPHPDDWFAEYYEPAVQRAFTHLYEDQDLRRAQARMWRVLAARFADHPAVLGYDLINEPMGEMAQGEDLPSAARRVEREQLTPMYNRLARAVRSVDRRAWLFVEPTPIVGEGVPTGLGTIEDRRVVYAPHFYNAAMEAGRDYDPAAGWIEAYEAAVTAYPRAHRIPVVVGEWGPPDSSLPNMGRFYRDALSSLARYSSGWAGYVWCYGGGYCAVDEAGRFRANKEQTAAPYAPAVAGAVRGEAWDPVAGVYRLSYDARAGATRLSLPSGGRGWRIEVSGGERRGDRVYARPGSRVDVTVERG